MSAQFYDSIEQAVTDILQEIDGDICLSRKPRQMRPVFSFGNVQTL